MRKDFIDDDELTRINKVNVLKASAHIDTIKMIGKTPVEINTHDEMVKKINESNDDEYWFEDSHIINNIMKNSNNVNNLSKTKRPVAMDEYTIAVNKIYPQIVDMINSTLVEMQGNGTILKICKAYIDNYDKCLL
jgi:ABC-type amino acid transport substrate-binding protein